METLLDSELMEAVVAVAEEAVAVAAVAAEVEGVVGEVLPPPVVVVHLLLSLQLHPSGQYEVV